MVTEEETQEGEDVSVPAGQQPSSTHGEDSLTPHPCDAAPAAADGAATGSGAVEQGQPHHETGAPASDAPPIQAADSQGEMTPNPTKTGSKKARQFQVDED